MLDKFSKCKSKSSFTNSVQNNIVFYNISTLICDPCSHSKNSVFSPFQAMASLAVIHRPLDSTKNYLPAGFTSEKKVPTFFPSTISVMTCPDTFGWVPLAITTEVPPCKAQRAAFT